MSLMTQIVYIAELVPEKQCAVGIASSAISEIKKSLSESYPDVKIIAQYNTPKPTALIDFIKKILKNRIVNLPNIQLAYMPKYKTENTALIFDKIERYIAAEKNMLGKAMQLTQDEQLNMLKILRYKGIVPDNNGKVALTYEQHTEILKLLGDSVFMETINKHDRKISRQINHTYMPTLKKNDERYLAIFHLGETLAKSQYFYIMHDDRSSKEFMFDKVIEDFGFNVDGKPLANPMRVVVCDSVADIYKKLTDSLLPFKASFPLSKNNNTRVITDGIYALYDTNELEKAFKESINVDDSKTQDTIDKT